VAVAARNQNQARCRYKIEFWHGFGCHISLIVHKKLLDSSNCINNLH
jgi:hypothetical protein